MLTLYHAPHSRSTSILSLIEDLGITGRVQVRTVTITRLDGSGARDPANPHPEGKVPYLVNGDDVVRERGAIVAYLTDMFPDAGLGRPVGHPQRGRYLGWLFYYQGVMEPVFMLAMMGVDNPMVARNFRSMDDVTARLAEALEVGPWLLGQDYSAVDLLLASPFVFFPDMVPDHPAIRDWVARCAARPSVQAAMRRDAG